MKTLLGCLLMIALPLLGGCEKTKFQPWPGDAAVDSDAAVTPPRILCDGSDDLRFSAAIAGGGPIEAGRMVLADNGFSFILVDGHCRYWVMPGAYQFQEVRTGVLDTTTLAEFVADFRYDRWPELNRVAPYGTPASDGSGLLLLDPETSIGCQTVCSGVNTPADVEAMGLANTDWNARLWAAGEAVVGDVRISVIESDRDAATLPPTWTPPLWTLTTPIASVAVSADAAHTLSFGDGVLITGTDADALRALGRDFLASGAQRTGIPILVHDDGGQLYEVSVRDTTPFEDARGLIRWPG